MPPLSGSGLRRRLRPLHRLFGRGMARANAVLHALPPGRWLHRRLRASLEITATEVTLERGGSGLDRLEIAFLSDLHAGLFMTADDLRSIGERVDALAPDLVCLGGDLINVGVRELGLLEPALELLDPPLGVFAVPGNHDYFVPDEFGAWRSFLEERGIHVLVNQGRRIERGGAGLWIAGVDDLTEGTPDVAAALEGRAADEPTLLLSHHPDVFVHTGHHGIDLQLSGHTHAGQIRLFGWAPFTHSHHGLVEGLHRNGAGSLYVGRGVGITTLPLRLGTTAEIAVVRLRTT